MTQFSGSQPENIMTFTMALAKDHSKAISGGGIESSLENYARHQITSVPINNFIEVAQSSTDKIQIQPKKSMNENKTVQIKPSSQQTGKRNEVFNGQGGNGKQDS